ncbi:MBL fold metallo-hydrolase [candidate division KSB1 bacterium]
MKNKIKFVCFAVFIFFLFLNSFAQQRTVEPVKFNRISDNLYGITGGRGANGGAYIGDESVLIIDAKMNKESVSRVFEELRKITDKPVKYLVNTHSDGDHITGNQFFPESVTIIAQKNCRKEFFHAARSGNPSIWNNPELQKYVPSITFKDKMNLYLGSKKVELWYFGTGHTTGDAVVFFPEEKAAFIGDQIFLQRVQLIHSYKGGNSFSHIKTLSRMLETLDAEKYYSGHSRAVSRDEIVLHIMKIMKMQDKVKDMIFNEKSLEEIKKEFVENESRLVTSIYNEIKNNEIN